MLGRLTEVLAGSGVELSEEELLDVLWLAGRLPRGAGPVARAAGASAVPRSAAGSSSAQPAEPSGDPGDPEDRADPRQPTEDRPAERPLHVAAPDGEPPAPGTAPPRAHSVRAPDKRLLDARELRLGRSLRPLRQRFPDHRRHELDIARTVAAMADTGLPVTATRPQRSRWLSLALVVDDGVSMVLWQRLASDVRMLMERAGAFRDVRVHGLDTRGSRAPLLTARPYRGGGPYLTPASLSDPTGATLVLVVSDGVGEAWRDGRMRSAVDLWARHGPTAVVHALPARLWRGSGISARPWHVTSHRRGGPTAAWRVADPVLPPGLVGFDSVPVPVLEPSPAAVAEWARLIASPGAGAVLPLWSDAPSPAARPVADTRHEDEAEAVLRFRAAASPEAYRLAAHLAAVAPVTPPVMRLVQGALGPPTDGGHVAEVFLGGLMRQAGAGGPGVLPHHQLFDFSAEGRRILLGAPAPRELMRTTRAVADRLEASVGRSPDFPAWVGHPDGSAVIGGGGRSFAWLTDRLLTRLGVPAAGAVAAAAGTAPGLPGPSRRADSVVPDVRSVAIPRDWSVILPTDPQRLGPYQLYARNDRGWIDIPLYLALDPNGETVTVRVPAPLFGVDPERARELIRTEATCLGRMQGVGAPALLDWSVDPEQGPPWLAAACLRTGDADWQPAPNLQQVFDVNGELFRVIGHRLARAVGRAHGLGLVHGSLTPRAVLVADDGVQLIGWITASVDGVHSRHRDDFPRDQLYVEGPGNTTSDGGRGRRVRPFGRAEVFPGPTPASDVYSVGAVLIAFATGRWRDVRADMDTNEALAVSGVEPGIAELLWRCLDRNPANRPTAAELAEALDPAPSARSELSRREAELAVAHRTVEPSRLEDELATARRMIDELRALATLQPGVREPELARALYRFSDRLARAGRREDACTTVAEAVGLYRRLADREPDAYRPSLAQALSNLAVRLGEARRRAEALDAITEAVELYRELCRVDPDSYRPGLALTLNNLSNCLGEAGRPAEAREAIAEAVILYRELHRLNPQEVRFDLARALSNFANRLGDGGQAESALALTFEAVELFREAARHHPDAVPPDFAAILDNLAVRLGTLGQLEEARAAHAESTAIRQTLPEPLRRQYEEDLELSHTIGSWLEDLRGGDA
ncbi:SAV_2336 N-terminal domain-related protein [Kitasatospora sp. NPDC090091]|uniref:SAV_2336 N-terminal domain-related protein n=1 Tax=Kitasatospora sp. NPDC090091 TaxID=3364081 RepID=UPI0037FD10E1